MARRALTLVFAAAALTLALAARADAYVYWSNWNGLAEDSIGRANTNGSSPTQTFILGLATQEPSGIKVNDDFIYWANHGAGTLSRANLDGSGTNNAFRSTTVNPTGVAINGTNIFWSMTNGTTTNNIGKADLDGTNPNQSLVTTASVPNGLAVNSSNIYWANSGDNHIAQSDLNGGSQNLTLVTLAASSAASGVAVDSQHIYWADQNHDQIGRADLDGGNPNLSFVSGADNPCDVAVGNGHLYWANFGDSTNGSIGRADISSGSATDVQQNFIPGAKGPCGVTVDRFPVGTSESVSCSPNAVGITQPTTCAASVTGSLGAAPTGAVSFSSGGGSFGSGGTCNLTASGANTAGCSVSYSRPDPATSTIHAAYAGDLKNATSAGDGDVKVGVLTLGKAKRNKKKGSAEIVAHVPGPGSVKLSGKSLKPSSASLQGAGDQTLAVKAKGKSKKKLKKKGKARVKPKVTFTPDSGNAEAATAKVTLIKK